MTLVSLSSVSVAQKIPGWARRCPSVRKKPCIADKNSNANNSTSMAFAPSTSRARSQLLSRLKAAIAFSNSSRGFSSSSGVTGRFASYPSLKRNAMRFTTYTSRTHITGLTALFTDPPPRLSRTTSFGIGRGTGPPTGPPSACSSEIEHSLSLKLPATFDLDNFLSVESDSFREEFKARSGVIFGHTFTSLDLTIRRRDQAHDYSSIGRHIVARKPDRQEYRSVHIRLERPPDLALSYFDPIEFIEHIGQVNPNVESMTLYSNDEDVFRPFGDSGWSTLTRLSFLTVSLDLDHIEYSRRRSVRPECRDFSDSSFRPGQPSRLAGAQHPGLLPAIRHLDLVITITTNNPHVPRPAEIAHAMLNLGGLGCIYTVKAEPTLPESRLYMARAIARIIEQEIVAIREAQPKGWWKRTLEGSA